MDAAMKLSASNRLLTVQGPTVKTYSYDAITSDAARPFWEISP